jgi:hypothetical protein
VSCVPDVSTVSRLNVVEHKTQKEDKTLNNLETLETSGKQDTEVRQRKHNLTLPLSLVCCRAQVAHLFSFLCFVVSVFCCVLCVAYVPIVSGLLLG